MASLNPDDTTAVDGWMPMEQNWPCSLDGRDGSTVPPVNQSGTSQLQVSVRDHAYSGVQIIGSPIYPMM